MSMMWWSQHLLVILKQHSLCNLLSHVLGSLNWNLLFHCQLFEAFCCPDWKLWRIHLLSAQSHVLKYACFTCACVFIGWYCDKVWRNERKWKQAKKKFRVNWDRYISQKHLPHVHAADIQTWHHTHTHTHKCGSWRLAGYLLTGKEKRFFLLRDGKRRREKEKVRSGGLSRRSRWSWNSMMILMLSLDLPCLMAYLIWLLSLRTSLHMLKENSVIGALPCTWGNKMPYQ